MDDANELKVKAKLDSMKNKRGGKVQTLDVNYSNDNNLNFQHSLDEMRQLCEMHQLTTHEIVALGNQMVWIATQVEMNARQNRFKIELEKELNKVFEKDEKEDSDFANPGN